jgi:zinc-ribbon domain
MSAYCPHCGASLRQGSRFCSGCGTKHRTPAAKGWMIGSVVLAILTAGLFYAFKPLSLGNPQQTHSPGVQITAEKSPVAQQEAATMQATPQMEPPKSGEWVRRVTSNQTMAGTGFYIVLGSFLDANGSAQNVVTNRMKAFMQCSRVKPNQALSHEFEGMRPDYAIVFLGGYHDHQMATEILAWAKKCQVDAYMKPARWVGLE